MRNQGVPPTTESAAPSMRDDVTRVHRVAGARVLSPGDEVAGFRIEAAAGRGGMGLVYRARQRRPQRTVAIKVISPEFAADPAFRLRFEQESAIAARIEHPNVIPVYEVGEADGLLYIAMRFVDGVDLGGLLARERRLEPERTARLVAQVADALDAAHAHGLVHRDVKPGNILVTGNDHVYLTDFGLTKLATETTGLTRSGAFVGTVDYIAPEQVRGRRVDARADVYALGCVTYQLLSGRVPFERDSEIAVILAHVNDPPPRLAAVPIPLANAVARAMAKLPDDRFLSAGDFARSVNAGVAGRRNVDTERSVATGPAAIASGAETAVHAALTPIEPAAPCPTTREWSVTSATQPVAERSEAKREGDRRRTWLIAAAVILLAAALGGAALALSGGKGSSTIELQSSQIATTADTYFGALAAGDGETACAQLSPGERTQMVARAAGSGARTCAAVIDRTAHSAGAGWRKAVRDSSLTNLRVAGTTATAGAAGARGQLELSDLHGRWLISGDSLRFIVPGGGPVSNTAPANGCYLTISFPFAQIMATPGNPLGSGERIPPGRYLAKTSEVLSFGGGQNRWYEISAGGKTGWIEDFGQVIASKSAACPIS